jgi:SAM-dependent methyltransferase
MPHSDDIRRRVKELSAASRDGMTWFDDLYALAGRDMKQIPWADKRPNRNLVGWLDREKPSGRGVKCLVVGCGLGDDAELLARWQYDVTAFDISPVAIDWARERFPGTRVKYQQADLFNVPADWKRAWDFVFEAYTVQPLPMTMRARAIEAVADLVKPGGELLLVSRAREDHEESDGPPWPLTRADVDHFQTCGLSMRSFEDYMDEEEPPVRRFRVVMGRGMEP